MAKEKYRSRVHMLLLYPSDETHVAALEKVKASYDYAACLHDRDYFTDADEKANPANVAGTLKKSIGTLFCASIKPFGVLPSVKS